jgi:hypothetical protein
MADSRVTVFICHSAIGDADTKALIDALQQALEPDYACFIDWSELETGKPWREPINTWLEHCDAAVLLLNRKAVDSAFVAYEVSDLMRRHRATAGAFTVIPVHVKNADPKLDVGYGGLQTSRLGPWEVDKVNATVFAPGAHAGSAAAAQAHLAATVAEIKQRLQAAAAAMRPVSEQMKEIVTLLKKVKPPELVTAALADVDIVVRPLRAVTDDQYLQLALALRSLSLKDARPIIQKLRGNLCDPDNHWKEPHLRRLFDLLAHFWVDPHSAATICATATGPVEQRHLALRAAKADTARLYVLRACPKVPVDNEWQYTEVQMVGGEELGNPDYVSGKIRERLAARLNTDPGELLEELKYFQEIDNPVFAALPGAGITTESLARIRKDFGPVTFIFLTPTSPPAALKEAQVREVMPALEPKDEDAFHDNYTKTWKVLRPQCG